MDDKYEDCVYCGGLVRPAVEQMEFRYKGMLYLVDDVPLGKCMQCGERFLQGPISERIEKVVRGEAGPPRKVEVDAYRFSDLVDAA